MVPSVFNFLHSLARGFKDHEFRNLFFLVAAILLIGTIFYHQVEGWRYLDSLYFSSISLTTVGYGDFAPQTDAGKIFTIVYIFLGIGVIVAFLSAVAKHSKKRGDK